MKVSVHMTQDKTFNRFLSTLTCEFVQTVTNVECPDLIHVLLKITFTRYDHSIKWGWENGEQARHHFLIRFHPTTTDRMNCFWLKIQRAKCDQQAWCAHNTIYKVVRLLPLAWFIKPHYHSEARTEEGHQFLTIESGTWNGDLSTPYLIYTNRLCPQLERTVAREILYEVSV